MTRRRLRTHCTSLYRPCIARKTSCCWFHATTAMRAWCWEMVRISREARIINTPSALLHSPLPLRCILMRADFLVSSTPTYDKWQDEQRARLLDSWTKQKVQGRSINYELVLAAGDPRERILEIAERRRVDMIVCGSTGQQGLQCGRSRRRQGHDFAVSYWICLQPSCGELQDSGGSGAPVGKIGAIADDR